MSRSTSAAVARPPGRLWWGLVALWAALSWVVLTSPPPSPQALPSWLPPAVMGALPAFDKAGHAALFLVQTLLLHRALVARPGRRSGQALLTALALTAVWGAATELRQAWVPGREADPLDLLADVAGGALYAAAAMLSRRSPLP